MSDLSVLFVGSYLSATYGSLCVSEKLWRNFREQGRKVGLVSRKKNKIARLIDILMTIVRSKADVVLIDVYSGQAFIIAEAASLVSGRLGMRIVMTLHGGALPEFYLANAARVQRVFRRASILTTPSKYLQQFFVGKGFEVQYVPNSIDTRVFTYDRRTVEPHSLLWVRAFDPIYNPAVAIKVLAHVLKSHSDAKLTMVGPDKGLLSETKVLARKLGVADRVVFTGAVRNQDLPQLYHTHAVFLNTPSYESFGVAVLEAAACGIPIVSSNVGEIPYIWENERDILVAGINDIEKLADHCVRLFDDAELAAKQAEFALQKSAAYAWDAVETQWQRLLWGRGATA